MVFSRVNFSEVKSNLGLPKTASTPTRKNAIDWNCYHARQRFTDYKKDVAGLWERLKKDHACDAIFETLFGCVVLIPFEPVEAALGSLIDLIKGLAGAILHPEIVIRNDLKPTKGPNTPKDNDDSSSDFGSSQAEDPDKGRGQGSAGAQQEVEGSNEHEEVKNTESLDKPIIPAMPDPTQAAPKNNGDVAEVKNTEVLDKPIIPAMPDPIPAAPESSGDVAEVKNTEVLDKPIIPAMPDPIPATPKNSGDVAEVKSTEVLDAPKITAISDPTPADPSVAGLPWEMVEALGGKAALESLPVWDLRKWNGTINEIPAPIMRGIRDNGCPFLVFAYLVKRIEIVGGKGYPYTTLSGEFIEWNPSKKLWEMQQTMGVSNQLSLAIDVPGTIEKGSIEERYMLDRINRLMKGEPVGPLVPYPSDMLVKPKDFIVPRPDDAYLEGEAFEEYSKCRTRRYERKYEKDRSAVLLCDPRTKQAITEFPYRGKS